MSCQGELVIPRSGDWITTEDVDKNRCCRITSHISDEDPDSNAEVLGREDSVVENQNGGLCETCAGAENYGCNKIALSYRQTYTHAAQYLGI